MKFLRIYGRVLGLLRPEKNLAIVLALADIALASLTKYTASDGDLTAGLVALNPAGPDAAELRRRLDTFTKEN